MVWSTAGRPSVPWHAASDEHWLQVTAAGVTGHAVSLVADPSGLAANVVHYATVTVTSPDPVVENQELIRVGLYVTDVSASAFSVSLEARSLVASPIEPVVFVSNSAGSVVVYNVYTGERVRTLPGVVANPGPMVTSGDGRWLYVYDRNNIRVQEVDATTGATGRLFSAASSAGTPAGGGLAYLRPGAWPTLIIPSSQLYDLTSGLPYTGALPAALYAVSLAASADSTRVVTDSGGVYGVRRSSRVESAIETEYLFSAGPVAGREGQACIGADATVVYTASGGYYQFPGTSMLTHDMVQVLPGAAYPNAIICPWNGLVIGGIDGYYDSADIWVYNGPTGVQLARLSSAGATGYRSLINRGMVASADGARLISLSSGQVGSTAPPELRSQWLPPPP